MKKINSVVPKPNGKKIIGRKLKSVMDTYHVHAYLLAATLPRIYSVQISWPREKRIRKIRWGSRTQQVTSKVIGKKPNMY